MPPRKYTNEELGNILKSLSKDGIAPSSAKYPRLRGIVQLRFGTWEKGCNYYGLKTMKQAGKITRRPRSQLMQPATATVNEKILAKQLAYLLHLAWKKGKTDKDTIGACINIVRETNHQMIGGNTNVK